MDGGVYTYDATAGANPPTSGTYDFRLISGSWTPPSDGVAGKFDMIIHDPNYVMVNKIKQKGEVTVWVGKTAATLTKVFLGAIEHIIIEEPNQSIYYIHLTGQDWGSTIIRNRIIQYGWYQQKVVGSSDPDPTDLNTRVGTLVKDILQQSAVYPNQYNNTTIEGMGVVVNNANIFAGGDGGVSLPYFEASFEYAGDKIDELASYAGAYWYVDPNKNFVIKSIPLDQSTVPDSGVLLTDDYNDSAASSYSGKVGLIAPNTSYDLSSENAKKVLYGLGGDVITIDQQQTTTSGGSDALDSNYYAVKFTPTKQNIESISVYVGKVGLPTSDLLLDLVYDLSGVPNGDTIRNLYINKDSVPASGGAWCTATVGDQLIIGSPFWIILRKQGTASNTYKWYKSGATVATASSTDGVTWTPGTQGYAFKTYTSSPLYMTLPNAVTTNQAANDYCESVIRKPFVRDRQTMTWFMGVESNYLFRYKEIFSCRVFAPDVLLQNAQRVRIRKQLSKYKFDANYVISGIEYNFQGGDKEGTGTFYYNITGTLFSTNTLGQTTGQA